MSQNKGSGLIEKTVDSEVVYSGYFLKVRRDQVVLPDGKYSQREYILHPGAALVVPVLDDGNLVVLRQYRHAVKQVFWEFPAGKIDKGEEPLTTAFRELQEETGYQAKHMRYMTSIHPVIGYADEVIHLYEAKGLEYHGENLDEGEHVEVHIKSLSEMMQLLRRGEITDVKTQSALFWYEKGW